MKASEKKLHQLNQAFTEILNRLSELREAQEQTHSTEIEAMVLQAETELHEVELELRAALDETMKELGPIWLEIGEIISRNNQQSLAEFKECLKERTAGCYIAKSQEDYAEALITSGALVGGMCRDEAEIGRINQHLKRHKEVKTGKGSLAEFTKEILEEPSRAEGKLEALKR